MTEREIDIRNYELFVRVCDRTEQMMGCLLEIPSSVTRDDLKAWAFGAATTKAEIERRLEELRRPATLAQRWKRLLDACVGLVLQSTP